MINSSTKKYGARDLSFNELNPFWVSGFVDAEGCFTIVLFKNKGTWYVRPIFQLALNVKDKSLIEQIKAFFSDKGVIYYDSINKLFCYRVHKNEDLINVIIPHFIKFPLLTQKRADFLLFKLAIELIRNKEHLTSQGLKKIVGIKASINRSLSEKLTEAFPDFIPVERPRIKTTSIQDPYWIAGFSCGESCFDVKFNKNVKNKLGFQTQLRFRIAQHEKDVSLLNLIRQYLNCGTIQTSEKVKELTVTRNKDIVNILIPFFNKYTIRGVKSLEYTDFCKIAFLMRDKAHLTREGCDQIINIKAGMNTRREPDSTQ